MNSAWRLFLEQQGARFDDHTAQDFGDPSAEIVATRDGDTLASLDQFGTLKVNGEDAQTFLQSLLSNDIRTVSPQQAQRSSFNTAKGRMLATFLIWQRDGDYFLQLSRTLTAPVQKKLSMYVLRSKVKVSDVSDEFVALGISDALLTAKLGLPESTLATTSSDAAQLIRIGDRRFQLICPADQASTWWQRLRAESGSLRPVGSACWDWQDIHAGIPLVTLATQEQFVPQMANMEVIGGVNFKKGCYPGQEIVARMQYLGKAKRRMYLAHIGGDTLPRPGDTLFSTSPDENAHGLVVNAASSPDGGFDLLGVLPIASREHNAVHLGSAAGERLDFLPLPYALP